MSAYVRPDGDAIRRVRRERGMTIDYAAARAGVSIDHAMRAEKGLGVQYRKLSAYLAVFGLTVEDVAPTAPAQHGTSAGYASHVRHGEQPCIPCLDARAAWVRDYRSRIRQMEGKP